MSRRKPPPPVQVQPDAVKATDVLVLDSRVSWAATRFALPPFPLAQMRYPLRHQLMGNSGHRYRIDGLSAEKRGELLALLDAQEFLYEVWR